MTSLKQRTFVSKISTNIISKERKRIKLFDKDFFTFSNIYDKKE